MDNSKQKSLGQAIDELILALKDLDENSRIIALKAVIDHLNIPGLNKVETNPNSQIPVNHSNEITNSDPGRSSNRVVDIQTLKEEKKPSNSVEMACVVAFYLSNFAPDGERNDAINASDIEKYFKQAKFPLPKAIQNVLFNGKTAGYFDSLQGGKYRLNPVGYNLVAHKMPRTTK